MKKSRHITSKVLMVRPARFGYNEETAENNAFQTKSGTETDKEIQGNVKKEFDFFVSNLTAVGVEVVVAKDSAKPVKTDAVFPNNWITFHEGGRIITYPMFAPSRRRERRAGIIHCVEVSGYYVSERRSFEFNEKLGYYLEGTGSIIFDRAEKKAYACLSPRTDKNLLQEVCAYLDYEPITFEALDDNGQQIYHTNVMMTMGEDFVVICLESIRSDEEKKMLLKHFKNDKKEVVDITIQQVRSFAGNMIQLDTASGNSVLVMSEQARMSLTSHQVQTLEKYCTLVDSPIYTIEKYGGGSARCMIAEIF